MITARRLAQWGALAIVVRLPCARVVYAPKTNTGNNCAGAVRLLVYHRIHLYTVERAINAWYGGQRGTSYFVTALLIEAKVSKTSFWGFMALTLAMPARS